jgi:HPt (histidine-containing phosphotransfer) domain-containing protein
VSDIHIDRVVLMTLQDVMENEYPTLLEAYLHDSEERLIELRRAQEREDAEGVRQAAHSFKGSCGNIGAPLLAKLCQQLEAVSRRQTMTQIDPLLGQIEREFSVVRILIKSELRRFKY